MRIRIELILEVIDQQLLLELAEKRCQAQHQMSFDDLRTTSPNPDKIAQAALEVILLSNPDLPLADLGLELHEYEAEEA